MKNSQVNPNGLLRLVSFHDNAFSALGVASTTLCIGNGVGVVTFRVAGDQFQQVYRLSFKATGHW